jgi:hypothetical protein
MHAGHNISPRLRKQLVLELKVGEVNTEIFQGLPSSVVVRKPTPLDQHMPDATALLRL